MKIRNALLFGLTLLSTQVSLAGIPEEVDKVLADKLFISLDCNNYLADLPADEKTSIIEVANIVEIDEVLRYLDGRSSSLAEFESKFSSAGYKFSPQLVQVREELKRLPDLSKSYADESYSPERLKEAIQTWEDLSKQSEKRTKGQAGKLYSFLICRVGSVAASISSNVEYSGKYLAYVRARPQSAQIGHFEVAVEKGMYGKKVGTGNKFAEPKIWEGSRFYTVYAVFKNTDTESRLPVEGSLFIKYDGKEYEFDSVEPIVLEGYNIWFRKLNPLVSMKTKIVYRIPDEIHGEVFWRPGRNPDDKKLWLGFVPASK